MDQNPESIKWHVGLNNEVIGPLDYSSLKALFSSGEANGQTQVWHDKMADWAEAQTVNDLSTLITRTQPPPLVHLAKSPPPLVSVEKEVKKFESSLTPDELFLKTFDLTPKKIQDMANHAVDLACQTKTRLKLAPPLRMALVEKLH